MTEPLRMVPLLLVAWANPQFSTCPSTCLHHLLLAPSLDNKKLLAPRVPHGFLGSPYPLYNDLRLRASHQATEFEKILFKAKLVLLALVMADELRLVSPDIDKEGRLPRKYTGEGQGAKKNISPPIQWYNVPEGTKTLALVVQDLDPSDPDGPIVPWTHWVVVNIPPQLKGLPEGFSGKEEDLGGEYAGIKEGINGWKQPGWRGPVLPKHGHRFEFKLYALDDEMHLGNKVTKEKLEDAIQGHVLGEASFLCTF